VEQFESLAIAEHSLVNAPSDASVYENFIRTADDVASNLKERYRDQWVDPKDDRNTVQQQTE
jgi:hypothetical protein